MTSFFRLNSIKKKIIALSTALLALVLATIAIVLIWSQASRATAEITSRSLNFAELSAAEIFDSYQLYYRSQAYAMFENSLNSILARNPAVSGIRIATAEGELLFDSAAEPGSELAKITDPNLLAQLQNTQLSAAAPRRVVYLKRDGTGYAAQDAEQRPIAPLAASERANEIVLPLADDQHRVIYSVSYAAVVDQARESILYLAGLFLLGFALTAGLMGWFAAGLTRPLAALREGANRIAQGQLDTRIAVDSNDETKLLADTFNSMAQDLAKSVETKLAFERTAKELEIASEIQANLLPKKVEVAGLNIAAKLRTASEVGGDVYDVLPAHGGKTVFYIGDATGHGTPAGIVSTLTNASLATAAMSTGDLAEIISRANAIVHKKTKSNMFVTAIAFAWDPEKAELKYAAAGHDAPLIFRAATGQVESGHTGGLALGMLAKLPAAPAVHSLDLAPGDVVLGYTDGIVEGANPAGELFGLDRLKTVFADACQQAGGDLDRVHEQLLRVFDRFRGEAEQADDISLVAFELAK